MWAIATKIFLPFVRYVNYRELVTDVAFSLSKKSLILVCFGHTTSKAEPPLVAPATILERPRAPPGNIRPAMDAIHGFKLRAGGATALLSTHWS